MPLINVKYIEGLVVDDAKKQELIEKLTDTFVSVCGDVTRPFLYVLIEEFKPFHWGVAGKPMPDDVFLTGEEYAAYMKKSIALLSDQVAQKAMENQKLTS